MKEEDKIVRFDDVFIPLRAVWRLGSSFNEEEEELKPVEAYRVFQARSITSGLNVLLPNRSLINLNSKVLETTNKGILLVEEIGLNVKGLVCDSNTHYIECLLHK